MGLIVICVVIFECLQATWCGFILVWEVEGKFVVPVAGRCAQNLDKWPKRDRKQIVRAKKDHYIVRVDEQQRFRSSESPLWFQLIILKPIQCHCAPQSNRRLFSPQDQKLMKSYILTLLRDSSHFIQTNTFIKGLQRHAYGTLIFHKLQQHSKASHRTITLSIVPWSLPSMEHDG